MSGPDNDGAFQEFYTEVKQIEKRDSVLTPKQQIERILRPGSSYLNLNPFEVLQVDPESTVDEIKTKYKRLSILVHPDKNQDDKDRAQTAFEVVNKAWKTLENDTSRLKCLEVVEEAKARTDINIAEKRKKLKKDGRSTTIEEDDPIKYKHAVYVMTMKLFADIERKRRSQETRDQEERKRKREEEIEAEEKLRLEKEWAKNFEESREGRVKSWQSFTSGGSSSTTTTATATAIPAAAAAASPAKKAKTAKKIKVFRPPKHKSETRSEGR